MRYRQLDATGDYVFGDASFFLTDSPAAVAQAIKTRLLLSAGDWFLDAKEGLDKSSILGYGTQGLRDQEIQRVILETPGVRALVRYASDVANRVFTVTATVDTVYGVAEVNASL